MTPTILLLSFFLAVQVIQLLLWGWLLWLGLIWAKAADVKVRRILAATIISAVAQIALGLLVPIADAYHFPLIIPLQILALAAMVLIPLLLIRGLFRITFLRSVQAWLPTLLAPVIGLVLAFGVMRPFLWEAFVCNANSMAPTLLGEHWIGVCPHCGSPMFCTPLRKHDSSHQPLLMICEQNFHVSPRVAGGDDATDRVHAADRFMVTKFQTPKRWDLVTFRLPEDPRQAYVKRIVGLPGETIVIKEGSVWANDQKLTPPPEIRNIQYLDALPDLPWQLSGTAENPAELGADEFFVLGDFSASSSDSRFWGEGAEGHPPYAVPRSHITGVVSLIYWPVNRWRTF